jgi:predicted ATPase
MTDVEGSTRMWEQHAETAGRAIERHDELIGAAVAAHDGVLIKSKGEGDSTFSVFGDAWNAAAATVELQRRLLSEAWPPSSEVRVRAALYTGEAELRAGDYHGIAPNRGGRLRAVAHGGQSICSEATKALVTGRAGGDLPDGMALRDLGLHRLRDLASAERVYQLVHPELPQEFPPLRSLGVRHNLPAPRTSFIGRRVDREIAQEHLSTKRLVTLTGVAGCGKTRLAIEVASQLLEQSPDGVFFVDLAPVTDVAALPAVFAAAVGFSRLALGTASGRPAEELIDYLSARRALLVVDNCEHVIEACADLVDVILERCPSVSILATSREALNIQGEQVHLVPPLGTAADSSGASESVQLFAARASLVQPGFAMTASDASAVAEVCRRLDGIPLAIELAAAQVPHLSPGQMVRRLDDRFRLLAGGRRGTRRQQTLHAALDWSHDLLAEDERVLLRRLAAFPGTFSHDAADAVCAMPRAFDLLRSLARKSLVVMEDDGPERRFRLLETVRAYAAERLEEVGETAAFRDHHRDHFLAWAESIPPELTYLDPHGSIRREADNLRAALAWSEACGRRDLVARLAGTMSRVWVADISEGQRWLSTGLDAVDALDAEHQVRTLAVAAQVAVLAMEAGDGELARRAVAASDDTSSLWSALAHALLCLNAGIRWMFTRDAAAAVEVEHLGQRAVELASEPLGRGLAWFWLGQARVLVGDLDGAIDALERGSVEAIPGGDMSPVSLAMLAGALHITGRHDEALAAATEVFDRGKSFNHSGLWAWVLYCSLPFALELGHRGRHDEAMAAVRDVLEDHGTPTTPGVMTSAVVVLAALAQLRGDIEVAGLLLEHSGRVMITEGTRTPIDIALHAHYAQRVRDTIDDDTAHRNRARAADMSLAEALDIGLGGA